MLLAADQIGGFSKILENEMDIDNRWKKYYENLNGISVENFHRNPTIQKTMFGRGSHNYLSGIDKGEYQKEFNDIFSRFSESPDLKKDAVERFGKLVHQSSGKYLMQLSMMHKLLDLKEVNTVVEIGGGFGGLARIFVQFLCEVTSYTNLDHRNMLRFFDYFNRNISNVVEGISIEKKVNVCQRHYDLFISNYCLSEVPQHFCDWVYENVLPLCKNVFIIDGEKNGVFQDNLRRCLSETGFDFQETPYPYHNCNVFTGTRTKDE